MIIYTGERGIPLRTIIDKLGNKSYPYIEVRCRWEENEYNYNEYIGSCSYDNKTETLTPLDYDSYSLDDLYEEWEEWKDDNGRINLTVWEGGTVEGENDYAEDLIDKINQIGNINPILPNELKEVLNNAKK